MVEQKWIPVTSSNLSEVMYDPDSRTLSIRFHSGAEYSYADVPPEAAQELIRAPSPGRYFNSAIKGAYDQV